MTTIFQGSCKLRPLCHCYYVHDESCNGSLNTVANEGNISDSISVLLDY